LTECYAIGSLVKVHVNIFHIIVISVRILYITFYYWLYDNGS